jgi:hypothetical protein
VRDAAPGEAVPRCDDQMALRVHLQARFLLMYAQLLLAGRGRDLSRYRDELGEVRELLDDIGCLIERNEGADAVAIAFKLRQSWGRCPRTELSSSLFDSSSSSRISSNRQ